MPKLKRQKGHRSAFPLLLNQIVDNMFLLVELYSPKRTNTNKSRIYEKATLFVRRHETRIMLLQFALLATKNQNQRATPHLYCNNNKAAANNKQHLQKRKSGQIKTFCSANNVKMESCKNI